MSRVPDAFILVSELDPLRDEGIDYSKKLQYSGVNVKLNSYQLPHGFFSMRKIQL